MARRWRTAIGALPGGCGARRRSPFLKRSLCKILSHAIFKPFEFFDHSVLQKHTEKELIMNELTV